MYRSFAKVGCVMLLLGMSTTAFARDPVITVDLALPLAPQKEAVAKALRSNDYNEVSREDRLAIEAAFVHLDERLAGHDAGPGLDVLSSADVKESQTVINTALARAYEDSRTTCERVRKTGSNRAERVCTTVAERRRARQSGEADRSRLENMQRQGRAELGG